MKKYGNAIIFLTAAMLSVACSTGGEEYKESYADPMSSILMKVSGLLTT